MSWQILSTSLVIGQGWQSVKLEKKSFIGRKQNKSLLNHLFPVRRKHRYDSKQLSILSHSHSSSEILCKISMDLWYWSRNC